MIEQSLVSWVTENYNGCFNSVQLEVDQHTKLVAWILQEQGFKVEIKENMVIIENVCEE